MPGARATAWLVYLALARSETISGDVRTFRSWLYGGRFAFVGHDSGSDINDVITKIPTRYSSATELYASSVADSVPSLEYSVTFPSSDDLQLVLFYGKWGEWRSVLGSGSSCSARLARCKPATWVDRYGLPVCSGSPDGFAVPLGYLSLDRSKLPSSGHSALLVADPSQAWRWRESAAAVMAATSIFAPFGAPAANAATTTTPPRCASGNAMLRAFDAGGAAAAAAELTAQRAALSAGNLTGGTPEEIAARLAQENMQGFGASASDAGLDAQCVRISLRDVALGSRAGVLRLNETLHEATTPLLRATGRIRVFGAPPPRRDPNSAEPTVALAVLAHCRAPSSATDALGFACANAEPSLAADVGAHCQGPIRAAYSLTFRNDGSRPASSAARVYTQHFSADERGLFEAIISSFLVQLWLLLVSCAVSWALAVKGFFHASVKLLLAASTLQWWSLVFRMAYLHKLGVSGVRSGGVGDTADALWAGADGCMLLLLVLLAKGWTVVRHKLSMLGRMKVTVYGALYFGVHFAALAWRGEQAKWASSAANTGGLLTGGGEQHGTGGGGQSPMYALAPDGLNPGTLLVLARVLALAWFCYASHTTARNFRAKRGFYRKFALLGGAWISFPLLLRLVVLAAPPQARLQLFHGGELLGFTVVQWVLWVMYCPVTLRVPACIARWFCVLSPEGRGPALRNTSFPFHVKVAEMVAMQRERRVRNLEMEAARAAAEAERRMRETVGGPPPPSSSSSSSAEAQAAVVGSGDTAVGSSRGGGGRSAPVGSTTAGLRQRPVPARGHGTQPENRHHSVDALLARHQQRVAADRALAAADEMRVAGDAARSLMSSVLSTLRSLVVVRDPAVAPPHESATAMAPPNLDGEGGDDGVAAGDDAMAADGSFRTDDARDDAGRRGPDSPERSRRFPDDAPPRGDGAVRGGQYDYPPYRNGGRDGIGSGSVQMGAAASSPPRQEGDSALRRPLPRHTAQQVREGGGGARQGGDDRGAQGREALPRGVPPRRGPPPRRAPPPRQQQQQQQQQQQKQQQKQQQQKQQQQQQQQHYEGGEAGVAVPEPVARARGRFAPQADAAPHGGGGGGGSGGGDEFDWGVDDYSAERPSSRVQRREERSGRHSASSHASQAASGSEQGEGEEVLRARDGAGGEGKERRREQRERERREEQAQRTADHRAQRKGSRGASAAVSAPAVAGEPAEREPVKVGWDTPSSKAPVGAKAEAKMEAARRAGGGTGAKASAKALSEPVPSTSLDEEGTIPNIPTLDDE